EREDQIDRTVEEKRLAGFAATRSNGCFEIDEAEIDSAKNVGDGSEQGIPAAVVGRRRRIALRGGGLLDRLVGNDVTGSREGDTGQLAGIARRRRCGSSCRVAVRLVGQQEKKRADANDGAGGDHSPELQSGESHGSVQRCSAW